MTTQKEEYYTYLLEITIEHTDRSKTPFSNEKLRQAINMIVEETKAEDEEQDAKHNANNVTKDTFIQPPVTTNTPKLKTDVANERQISSESLI